MCRQERNAFIEGDLGWILTLFNIYIYIISGAIVYDGLIGANYS